jgi:hypothetical protein
MSHPDKPATRGQVIVIFAVTLLALLFFAGLAIDSGSLYITYAQLRRSIDSAAIAASNEYKKETGLAAPVDKMKAAASEMLKMNGLDPSTLHVYVCDADGNGERDPSLATANPEFFAQCPVTNIAASKLGRKLVWLDATVSAPLYFLQLLGFHIVPMTSSSIAEAASIDLVIVIDTSQSMANATVPSINGDPTACNATDTCEPLLSAKNAANSLIDTLYPNYDQVAIVGFDVMAKNFSNHLEGSTWYEMRTNLTAAKADVANLKVHDDPDPRLVWYDWSSATELVVDGMQTLGYHFNPVYPEDRDGDGLDADPNADPKECDSAQPGFDSRWQDNKPCDMDTILDAFNGDDHGTDWGADPAHDLYTPADTLFSKALVAAGTACDANNYDSCNPPAWTKLTVNSTCTGCGIRVGAQILKRMAVPNQYGSWFSCQMVWPI